MPDRPTCMPWRARADRLKVCRRKNISHAQVALNQVLGRCRHPFSRKLAGCDGVDDVLWATACQMAATLEVRVLQLPEGERVTVRASYPPGDEPSDADLAAV